MAITFGCGYFLQEETEINSIPLPVPQSPLRRQAELAATGHLSVTIDWGGQTPPTGADIMRLALKACAGLPEPYREIARGVRISVEEIASAETVAAVGLDDPYELTGLYEGEPLGEASVLEQAQAPNTITLFRVPILAEWTERRDIELGILVEHIVIHELAHQLGMTDGDIARIDRWWE